MNTSKEGLSSSCSYCGDMVVPKKMTLIQFRHPISERSDIADRFNSWSWYCEGCVKDYKLKEKFRRDRHE